MRIPEVLIELRPSKMIRGEVGVFAARPIRKGRRIASGINKEDYGLLRPWAVLDRCREPIRRKVRDFCVGTPLGFIPPEGFDFNRLSVEWYINHSCDGNVGFNENGDFIARRNIRKGEEITYDYGLAESNPAFRMRCKCNARNCRGIITGNDWKGIEFRSKNLRYMLPKLRHLRPTEE
jgi:SET domain-containing protein